MTTAKALLLFGATADLAQRMLPSLHGRHANGLSKSALRMIRPSAETGELVAFVDDLEGRQPRAAPPAAVATAREQSAFPRSGADSAEHGVCGILAEMELAA